MKKYLAGMAMLLVCAAASAQQATHTRGGKAPYRAEFVSYDTRETAETGDPAKSPFYVPLDLRSTPQGAAASFDIPGLWLDREIFLHVEGWRAYTVSVGSQRIGGSDDSRTPAEYNISKAVTDGANTVSLTFVTSGSEGLEEAVSGEPRKPLAYIYSQPKLRIEDFRITAEPDPTDDHGILTITIAVANGYNSPEAFTVGYDIYSPQGKLQYYDMREVRVAGQGRDTVVFRELIYGTPKNLWSQADPKLYHGMLTVKHDKRMIEYIPYKTGFGKTETQGERILRNGRQVTIRAAGYNADPDPKVTRGHLDRLKEYGINTVAVDYPQPLWFYEMCDREGMYVIDQPNINSGGTDNRNVGGTPANDPRWVDTFMDRTQVMFARTYNHPCVIAWSLGGRQGNGYNFYKTYQWLKANEEARPVIYGDAAGEWNSDLLPIPSTRVATLLYAPAEPTPTPTAPARRKR